MEMDTPERTHVVSSSTAISKVEESPVFNFLNNLSPIKPAKPVHLTQTFSSLTFASPPAIFTSPHISSDRESRFLGRCQTVNISEQKSPSKNVDKPSTNEGAESELQDNLDKGKSIASTPVEQPTGHTEFANEVPHTFMYDFGSPDCGPIRKVGLRRCQNIDHPQQEDPKNNQTEQRCDWESLVSDAADLLIFSSPNDAEAFRGIIQKSPGLERGLGTSLSNLPQNNITDSQKMQHSFQLDSGEQADAEVTLESLEIKKAREDLGCDDLASMGIHPSGGLEDEATPFGLFADGKSLSNLQHGMRRRCLDFEMVGVHCRKKFPSICSSSHSKDNNTSKNLQLKSLNNKRGGESSRFILPGIGLHLNSLASGNSDCSAEMVEIFPSESQAALLTGQELLPTHMISTTSEKGADESGDIVVEDNSLALVLVDPEELNPDSPRKKRRKVEPGEEAEACKRCNCKKSKCLKLYCECFAAGVYCIEPCACQDCFNKPIHEDTVLATRKQIESRNPLAFAPKVIRGSDSNTENRDESMKTPASARHKRGCNCKKSSCLKKYCECYQGGVGCSINCRCEGCKNAFGTKDGSVLLVADSEAGEELAEKHDVISLKPENLRAEEQAHPSVLPNTPSGLSRPTEQMAFPTSKCKPSQSSFLAKLGNSTEKIGKSKLIVLAPPTKFEKPPQQLEGEDEMPQVLRGTTSGMSQKTASPNGKRVSPPHGELSSTPSLRSGRRLILQSIPSFPSLTPQH
ncbi:hypothetical protein SAY87_027561 [Trapa incisa]|uniref:CRC domain-containing protein n=1 Tax=Trapa incisa TaxID=236973 RepID=A0AAN7JMX8_9MYRT|nr:hypothetical protein SAY87_027561 [Trapa incisa]